MDAVTYVQVQLLHDVVAGCTAIGHCLVVHHISDVWVNTQHIIGIALHNKKVMWLGMLQQ